jgi:hypothetical protein
MNVKQQLADRRLMRTIGFTSKVFSSIQLLLRYPGGERQECGHYQSVVLSRQFIVSMNRPLPYR